MQHNIPEIIQPLLTDYLTAIERDLPGFVSACYLHGSIALGAFNEHVSDVDFITVISRRCTRDDLLRLADIHQQLELAYPRWPLQGSYLQWSDLGQSARGILPAPYYSDGVLHPAGHHDINPVTWWLVKNRGVALAGRESQALDFSVDWAMLIDYMHKNLNSYWKSFTREPSRIAWLLSDYGVQWTVLGVLRQYYTVRERDITSKNSAGDYALTHIPEKWHRIVHESLNIRNQAHQSFYQSRLVRAVEAYRFLKFIIDESNSAYFHRRSRS